MTLIVYRCSNCGRVELRPPETGEPPYCVNTHSFPAAPQEGVKFPSPAWERLGSVDVRPLEEPDATSG